MSHLTPVSSYLSFLRLLFILFLIFPSLLRLIHAISPLDDPLLAVTEHGVVRGRYNLDLKERIKDNVCFLTNTCSKNDSSRMFLNIPYADPPVGMNRFRSPQNFTTTWGKVTEEGIIAGDIRETTHFPSACIQAFFTSVKQSEDCLYLNVFVPSEKRMKKIKHLPVMFWIYGGAFYFGDTYTLNLYNPKHIMEKHDVIVVTFNHRVGPLGFWASEETGTNFGIEDQQAALRWVQRNIHNFGGDPQRVLLYGVSSGGLSAAIQMTSPLTKGLFQRVAMLSTPLGAEMRHKEDIDRVSRQLAQKLDCFDKIKQKPNVECMRAVPAKKIRHAGKPIRNPADDGHSQIGDMYTWWPSVDGRVIREQPRDSFREGRYHRDIPIIIGTNKDETRSFFLHSAIPIIGPLLERIANTKPDEKRIRNMFGNYTDTLYQYYHTEKSSPTWATDFLVKLTSDYAFHCPAQLVAEEVSKRGGKVFKYIFASQYKWLPGYGQCVHESCHVTDLNFYWQRFPLSARRTLLSNRIIKYLVDFAATGDVNEEEPELDHSPNPLQFLPKWPLYNVHKRWEMLLSHRILKKVVSTHLKACGLWNQEIGYKF